MKRALAFGAIMDPKDFSILEIHAPVYLEGKIRDPHTSIGKGIPFPFIELGEAEDIRCDLLLKGVL